MNEKHKRLIQTNYMALCDAISVDIDSLVQNLWQIDLLSDRQRETILQSTYNDTPRKKADCFLGLILNQGSTAFEKFYEEALHCKLWGVADILQPKRVPHGPHSRKDFPPSPTPETGQTRSPGVEQRRGAQEQNESPSSSLTRQDSETLKSFREHQELVKNHKVPLGQNDYITLATLENIASVVDGPARQILNCLLVIPFIVAKICEKKTEALRSKGYTDIKAMKEYLENTQSNPTQADDIRFYYVQVLPGPEEKIAAFSRRSLKLLNIADKKVYKSYTIDASTRYSLMGFWKCQVIFRNGSVIDLLTNEREQIIDQVQDLNQSTKCKMQ